MTVPQLLNVLTKCYVGVENSCYCLYQVHHLKPSPVMINFSTSANHSSSVSVWMSELEGMRVDKQLQSCRFIAGAPP